MTAPTWAEARRAEQEAEKEHAEMTRMLRLCEGAYEATRITAAQYQAAVAKHDASRTNYRAARRASDLALVRETLAAKTCRCCAGDYTDPAAVLAALEQEGR